MPFSAKIPTTSPLRTHIVCSGRINLTKSCNNPTLICLIDCNFPSTPHTQLFTDGITNKLVGCFNQNNNNANCDAGDESASADVVLVRVYGNKTDLLIDRKKETENIRLLHRYGYAPALYATFRNGLAYEFVPGVTLTPDTVRDGRTWPLVARRMAQMHKVEDGVGGEPMLRGKMDQFLKLLPAVFSDAAKHAR